MLWGDRWPYTNFHRLNLDWIIGVVAEFRENYEHIDETVQEAIATLNTEKNEIEQEFSTDIQNMLNQFTSTANTTINNLLETIPADYTDLANNVEANNNKLEALVKSTHANFNLPFNAFYANTGDTIKIKANSVTGRITIFTINYPNDNLQIEAAGTYTYTVQHDGYIRFYPSENNSVYDDVDIFIITSVQKVAENNYYALHPYNVASKQSFTSDLYVKAGQTIKVDVKQIAGNLSIFVANHSENAVIADGIGEWYLTAQHDGFIRFYLSDNLSVTDIADVYVVSKIDDIPVTPLLNEYLTSSLLYPEIIKNSVNYATLDSAANIYNYENYARASNVAKTSAVIKIRNNAGKLIYNFDITNRNEITSAQDAYAYFAFNKNGKYIRYYGFSDIPVNIFDEDIYYVIFAEYPSNDSYSKFKWFIKPVHIDWLKTENVYHVGAGQEFTTFTEALTALENNSNEKTIIIHPGTYNIFNEIGGETYINTIYDIASNLNWRDVCKVVPPNTKIKGIGKVKLVWNPTAAQIKNADTAFLFSPLNLSGSAEIENVIVECTNGRYAIHDECSGRPEFDNIKRRFKNVIAINHGGTYTSLFAYGNGHGKRCNYEFDNCKFITEAPASAFSTHDWHQDNEYNTSEFNIVNSIIISPTGWSAMRLSSSDTVGKRDNIRVNNSHITKGINFGSEDASTSYQQGYTVTALNCNELIISHADNVTLTETPEQYNTI